MNIKVLFLYVNRCKVAGIEPTWKGLIEENARTKAHRNRIDYRRA